jgi:uncharacterized protein (UPF0212 family)
MAEALFDVSITKCPKCGKIYADASWYVAEIGSDVGCGVCGNTFNSRKNITDRALLKFDLNEAGRISGVNLFKSLLP